MKEKTAHLEAELDAVGKQKLICEDELAEWKDAWWVLHESLDRRRVPENVEGMIVDIFGCCGLEDLTVHSSDIITTVASTFAPPVQPEGDPYPCDAYLATTLFTKELILAEVKTRVMAPRRSWSDFPRRNVQS